MKKRWAQKWRAKIIKAGETCCHLTPQILICTVFSTVHVRIMAGWSWHWTCLLKVGSSERFFNHFPTAPLTLHYLPVRQTVLFSHDPCHDCSLHGRCSNQIFLINIHLSAAWDIGSGGVKAGEVKWKKKWRQNQSTCLHSTVADHRGCIVEITLRKGFFSTKTFPSFFEIFG